MVDHPGCVPLVRVLLVQVVPLLEGFVVPIFPIASPFSHIPTRIRRRAGTKCLGIFHADYSLGNIGELEIKGWNHE
jgi:hypothetical protein